MILAFLVLAPVPPAFAEDVGITVPEGFRVDLFADYDLAHDIHSMTLDSLGRVVVSGPGYIRTLLDSDLDGKADKYREFVDRPQTGSQGMFFMGSHLLCSGDEGLQIFRDDNQDGKADGPPEVFLRISAGGEHHVHSIQKGPDGWWYIIAGNMSGVTGSYATLPTSPLKQPESGTLLRLKPDLSGGEIVADGYRNAYDFAFSISGDIFTFDSDGERDVSLPWYEPTRVFQMTPRSHAGWISRSWKRPARFSDMPPVVGSFDRGSPTGVTCYRHHQFPNRYMGAIFIADWTFGRIIALPLEPDGSVWKSEPIEFATGSGQFGFAPTDMAVGRDGSLFVSVGGRGTRGGVYRIVFEENEEDDSLSVPDAASELADIDHVLRAVQPDSSWSRARWMPKAARLGKSAFVEAAVDSGRTAIERVRAIEILTENFGGLDHPTAIRISEAKDAVVRARAAWSVGRSNPEDPHAESLLLFLADADPLVQRCAFEALTTATGISIFDKALPRIAVGLGSPDRFVRAAASSVVPKLNESQRVQLTTLLAGDVRGMLWMSLGMQSRSRSISLDAAGIANAVLQDAEQPVANRLDAARLMQLSLGDVGPKPGRDAMFDSYGPRLSLESADLELNPLRISVAGILPSGDRDLDHEVIRLIGMLAPPNRDLIDQLLAGITDESHPADDIHRLATLALLSVDRTYDQTVATAQALVSLDVKIKQRSLKQDSNWDDRMGELYRTLCKVDPAIPQVIVEQPGFGLPGHVLLLSEVGQDKIPTAIKAFTSNVQADDSFRWTNDVVFVIGESKLPEHQQLLREQLDNLSVRDAVLMVIAESGSREDRSLFVEGLSSAQVNAVEACLNALTKLPRNNAADEQFALLAVARRMMNDIKEFELREKAVRLLQNNTGQSFDFTFGIEGHRPQSMALAEWEKYLQTRYPDYRQQNTSEDAVNITALLQQTDWDAGQVAQGEALFNRLSCAKCHGGRRALGPDLQGVAKRFSRDDLFAAITDPNRDVSPRYQTTSIETTSGRIYTGLIVYESVDGMLLRDAGHNTYRIEAHEIESRQKQPVSLMPTGLLKQTKPQDLADLYEYLKSL